MDNNQIKQLQVLEHSMQSVLMQKQQFQTQLFEIESALSELSKTNNAYKIVGNIMVASKKEDLKKDLDTKKELFSARLKILDGQENKIKEEVTKIQKQLMKEKKE